MRKYEIVNTLIARNAYQTYLEICTAIAGQRFSRIDRGRLRHCHRLMYRCPTSFQDGSEITLRSTNDDISHLLKKDPAQPYDLIFIDAHHTLECSARDLQTALEMLSPAGAIVVHDCSPPTKAVATPWFHPGSWCGVMYCAYIDFVFSHPDLAYYTVDTDFGCGVIKRASTSHALPSNSNQLIHLWHQERTRQPDMFDFFRQHRQALLHLIPVKDFLSLENARLSPLSRLQHWRDTVATLLQT
jgi:Methyltransferase domain